MLWNVKEEVSWTMWGGEKGWVTNKGMIMRFKGDCGGSRWF